MNTDEKVLTEQEVARLAEIASTPTQVFQVTDAERGQYKQVASYQNRIPRSLLEQYAPWPRKRSGAFTLNEADAVLTESARAGGSISTMQDIVRQGIQFDAMASYTEQPITYPMFVDVMQSDKEQEEWLRDAGIGVAPIVEEGQEFPMIGLNLDSGVIIKNYKRGFGLKITEEMRRFDKIGIVRQLSEKIGRAMRMTEEHAVYAALTTTANYTRNSTTGDNDIGANYAATTFAPGGLITAFSTLTTMKDRTSGAYLGVVPDTLIVSPRVWWAAKQLLESPDVMRAHSDSDSTVVTVEVYGTGTKNSFFGIVNQIIVSPWIGANYEWALLQRNRALVFQQVDAIRTTDPVYHPEDDSWHYYTRSYFGVGMKDDHFAYLSTSTTAPTTV